MGLNTQRKVALVRREAAQGADAIAGVPTASRGTYGIPTLELDFSGTRESIDRRLHSGDFGREPTLVGYGQGRNTMGVDLRGSGNPNRVPNYDDLLQSCGLRRQVMRRSLFVAAPGGDGAEDVLTADERLHRGEQLHCETGYESDWSTTVVGGSLVNALGSPGLVGDTVEFFPSDGDETQPTAVGTISQIDDAVNRFTVRMNPGETGRPKSGDLFKVTSPDGLTLRGYNSLAEDMPVLIVLDYDVHAATSILARICFVVEQGSEPAIFRHMVGQQSGVLMVYGDGEDHGYVYRPTSDQLVQFVVDWGGSAAIPADLVPGREFIRRNATGNPSAAFTVHSVTNDTSGPTDKSTIVARMTFGTIQGSDTVYFQPLGGGEVAATVDPSPAPFASESPSVTIWNVIDGFLRGISGARGNVTLECEAGNPGRMSFEHTGLLVEQGRQIEQPTGVRGSDVTPPNWQSGRGEIAGVPLRFQSFSANLQNSVTRRPNANAAEGTEEYAVTDRDPNVQLTVGRAGFAVFSPEERERLATWTPAAVFVGNASGNRIGVVVPRGQVMSPQDGDQDNTLTVQIDLMARRIAEDGDELFLVHR